MKKITLSIIFLCLLIASGEVSAANWIHLGKSSLAGEPVDVYVDGQSVVKSADAIIFWRLIVWEKPDMFIGAKLELQKWEAKPIRQGKKLEMYVYDINQKLISSNANLKSSSFTVFDVNSPLARIIDAAFSYAKEGKDSGQKPALP